MHPLPTPPQPITEELSESRPSREAAVGRWLMSGLHTFLMRPLTFSTIGTIPLDCSASTHPNAARTHTWTPADRRAQTDIYMHEKSNCFVINLAFPLFSLSHTSLLHTFCREVHLTGKEYSKGDSRYVMWVYLCTMLNFGINNKEQSCNKMYPACFFFHLERITSLSVWRLWLHGYGDLLAFGLCLPS